MENGTKKEMMASEAMREKEKAAEMNKDAESPSNQDLKYPKVVFFIIGNEFCERFSFYGMRTILSLFFINALKLTEANATVIYHVFTMLCYFFPLIGAIIADSWLGKFKTIAYLSVVYAIGNVLVSFASATVLDIPSRELTFLGLLLIAIGTGGIKPCVSTFGGDQFTLPQQAKQLAAFFSVFYFSINAGSLISTYLTPELRTQTCLGMPTCFPAAFGVPAILMILSLVIFIFGKPGYKIVEPKGNVLVQVSGCVWSAWRNKLRSKERKEHWIEHADARFSEKLRSDIRAMLRVLLLFVPLPIFWALYDQQGSRWTFQANNMNGRLGSWTIKPDQMQVVNPLLVMLLLPLFQTVVYPAFNKVHLLTRPLQKMATGGVIAAIAFVISGVLELQLQPNYPVPLSEGLAQVRLLNGLPCNVTLDSSEVLASVPVPLERMGMWTRTDIAVDGSRSLVLDVKGPCLAAGTKVTLDLLEEKSLTYQLYTTDPESQATVALRARSATDTLAKDANPRLRLIYSFADSSEHSLEFLINDEVKTAVALKGSGILDNPPMLEPAEYSIKLDKREVTPNQLLDVGGVYTVMIDRSDLAILTLVAPNVVHLMWLLPQYIVITVAEVMFSVTGLEFAFTQAPVSMKSVLTSAWLLTVAFGNLIVVLITEIRFFSSQANEFFLFAGLMMAVMLLFIWLAIRYTYVQPESISENDSDYEANQMTSIPNGDDKTGKS